MTATSIIPLVVDMDGTLFSTDSNELMLAALRRRPLHRLDAWRYLRRGDKAAYKLALFRHSRIDPATFLVYEPVRALIEREARARPVHLATGAPQVLAERAAARFAPKVDCVFGTEGGHNNTGSRKAGRLVDRFGERGFDYAGNAPADLAVWQHARRAYVCNAADSRLTGQAALLCEVAEVL